MNTNPNVLIITTDQQHYDTISAAGNKYVRTPGLDHLYETGTFFSNAYTTNPLCGPARSSIMTGRMPCETGVYSNGFNIRKGIPVMGTWFREAGYETVYAGKWHLRKPRTSVIDGFDVIMTGINVQGNVSDSCITSSVEAYLRNYGSEKPFLMMAMYVQPHDICGFNNYFTDETDMLIDIPEEELPELPPNFSPELKEPERLINFRNRIPSGAGNWDESKWRYYLWHYYRYVEGVDLEIKRLLDTLRDTGLDNNTIVVFASDHGENAAGHKTILKNTLYNESCRVPFLVKTPESLPARTDHPVSLMDIFPTICEYCDIDPPKDIRGKSLATLIENGVPPERTGIPIEGFKGEGRAYIWENYKYIAFNDEDNEQLFDLERDPYETKNLIDNDDLFEIREKIKHLMNLEFGQMEKADCLPESSLWE